MKYDPHSQPAADKWLALEESERMALVKNYHKRARIHLPSPVVHAAIHTGVETQIAMQLPAVLDAFQRLQAEGLDRHDIIHAIGSVLFEHMRKRWSGELVVEDPNPVYYAALSGLTVASWYRDYGMDEPSSDDR